MVRALCLLVVGCYTGGLLFVAIAPSVVRQPLEVFVPYWQALNHDYAVLPPFLIGGVALMVATTVAARTAPVTLATAALATLLFVASIVVTVTQMVPLNELADRWSAVAPPAEAAAVRDRWWRLHIVRTGFAVAAFILLVSTATILTRPAHSESTAGVSAPDVVAGVSGPSGHEAQPK